MNDPISILITLAFAMFIVIGGLSMIAHFYTLNGIKSKTVGDGQHGVARFLTGKEIKKVYQPIKYDVKHWREGKNLPTEQGLVVGSASKSLVDRIKGIITDYHNSQDNTNIENELCDLEYTLYSEPDQSDEYDDDLVRQLIDTIRVMENDTLLINFRCGITYEQPLKRNIRRSNVA